MRITGLGHAGMFIETRGGSILCDPVIGPTFFGSWFPFPDNRGLDWQRFGKADFLYISHRHRDHFDPALMHRFVPKDIDWAHFDTFAWRPAVKPGRPRGGEALALRAAWHMIRGRFQ